MTEQTVATSNVLVSQPVFRLRHPSVSIALTLLIAVSLPFLFHSQYVMDVGCQVGIYFLLASGLNVVVGLAGLLDLGYIAFAAIGAYLYATGSSDQFGLHLPLVLILPLAALASAIFAVLVGLPTLRLRGDYLAIVTLGFGEVVRIALINGGVITGGTDGIAGLDPVSFFGHRIVNDLTPYYWLIVVTGAVGALINLWIRHSRIGAIWRSLRDDEMAARSCGFSPLRYYLCAFAIGAAYAGVAGALFAAKAMAVAPTSFTIDQSIFVLAIVIMGGMSGRSLPLLWSAVAIVALPEMLRDFESYRMVVFGPLLVVVTVARTRWPDIVRLSRSLRGVASLHTAPRTSEHAQGE